MCMQEYFQKQTKARFHHYHLSVCLSIYNHTTPSVQAENETIFELEKKLHQSKNRLAFLVDHSSFSPAEMRLNSNTFMWHGRMPAIFEEHKLIVGEKRSQYEEALKLKRERFEEELESYAKQVDELQQLGDVATDEMFRVFNMGVGMVLVVPSDQADELVALALDHGHPAVTIGEITPGTGVVNLR